MGYHGGLTGYLVLAIGEAQAVTGCQGHLQSTTGGRERRSPTVTGSIAAIGSWWLY